MLRLRLCAVTLLLTVATCLSPSAFAQTTVCDGQSGSQLFQCVKTTFDLASPQGYGPARDILYGTIDADNSNNLEAFYTGYTITLDPNQDPTQDAYAQDVNAEHIYPQSQGAGSEPEKGDMHNLRATWITANGDRGSLPFGESADASTYEWYYLTSVTSSTPTSNIDRYSERGNGVWEPRESVKGDVARAVFYFRTVHCETANTSFFSGMKDILLTWHTNDPITQAERDRSSAIASYQGNENPFVVDATLAGRLYGNGGGGYSCSGGGDPGLLTLLDEDFQSGSFASGWTVYSNGGTNNWIVDSFSGDLFAEMTEYQGSGTHDDWLITPALDFDAYDGEQFSFDTIAGFRSGNALTVMISTDYSGSGDPSAATWTPLSVTLSPHQGGGFASSATPSGLVDLSSISGTGYIAFHFQESSTDYGTWQVDNVRVQASEAIPVEFAGMNVRTDGRSAAVVEWATLTETNNAGFDVLRRGPEEDAYRPVARVSGAGTTTQPQQYRVRLDGLTAGTHWIRLRQNDVDGAETLTEPASIVIAGRRAVYLRAPNPLRAGRAASLIVRAAASGDLRAELFDVMGRRIRTMHRGTVTEGAVIRTSVDTGDLASGTYFLRVTGAGLAETVKMSVVR